MRSLCVGITSAGLFLAGVGHAAWAAEPEPQSAHLAGAGADSAWRGFSFMPGAARAVPRTDSASRDAFVVEYAYGPRAQASVGAEFGVLAFEWTQLAVRAGFQAMVAFENHRDSSAVVLGQLWRGKWGVSSAISAPALAERWLGSGGGLELGVVLAHESGHGVLEGTDWAPDDFEYGGGGDWMTADLALRAPLGERWGLVLRVQDRIYLRGDLLHAPGADVVLRWRAHPKLHPILALFGEGLLARADRVDNGFFARAMGGVALPGTLGEVTLFGSVDVGHGKGLLINTRELRLSFGVRYAPFQ